MERNSVPAGIIVAFALAALAAVAPQAIAAQSGIANATDPHRPARVEEWLKAVLHHQPGEADDAASIVASWSEADLSALQVDLGVLVQIMRAGGGVGPQFEFSNPGQPRFVRYGPDQYRRMKVLACAGGGGVAGGAVAAGDKLPRLCEEARAPEALDAELKGLAVAVNAAKLRGDHDNFILRRGALLHADIIALLARRPSGPLTNAGAGAPAGEFSLAMSDGEGVTASSHMAMQLEIARKLLDQVIPPHEDVVAPAHDDMVRQWYVATATWMQQAQQYMTNHLSRARALFPRDADILFLSGCERETYASPAIQSAVRSASLPLGVDFEVASDQSELRAAEGFFRGALAARPAFGEAHLRLGRVLLLRGRSADAVAELQQAIGALADARLRYYAQLFLGAAQEATGQFDPARASYEKAVQLSPRAQSPRLALSALARRSGDRGGALRALQDVFELPEGNAERDEPWWSYFVAQARTADALLAELRKPFLEHPN